MNNRPVYMIALAILSTGLPAHADMYYDVARVIDSQPIYASRDFPTREQQCGYETAPPTIDPALLGDIRAADPGAGLLDALQADASASEQASEVYRCRTVTTMENRSEPVGYRVRYEYDGRVYERRVVEKPGDSIRVRVRITAGRQQRT